MKLLAGAAFTMHPAPAMAGLASGTLSGFRRPAQPRGPMHTVPIFSMSVALGAALARSALCELRMQASQHA